MKVLRLVVLAGVIAATCLGAPATGHEDADVHVQANAFRWCDPANIACDISKTTYTVTIQAGQSVEFYYNDPFCDAILLCPGHDIEFGDGVVQPIRKRVSAAGLQSADRLQPVLMTRTFSDPGTYAFWCNPHEAMGMVGTVVVQDAPPTTG